MKAGVWTAVVFEGSVCPVEVQVKLHFRGLPRWKFTGRVGTEVREAKERILSAFQAAGFRIPRSGVHVALLPASIRKTGTGFDLAIGLAVLQAHALIPPVTVAAVAELDLEGRLLPVAHEYALVDSLLQRGQSVMIARSSVQNFSQHPFRDRLVGCETLQECLAVLTGKQKYSQYTFTDRRRESTPPVQQISQSLLRILCLCLAGGHHTLLLGSPGVGKSMTKEVLEYLLPEETVEALRQRKILESLAAKSRKRIVGIGSNITRAELLGTTSRPGLIHSGAEVLFLDELLEFRKECREGLRQYLEIQPQTESALDFARTLVATSNPCPCGFAGTPHCQCRPDQKAQYLQKLSGSFLDRVAIVWRVGEKDQRQLSAEEWKKMKQKIHSVRQRQRSREKLGFPAYARNYSAAQLQQLQPIFRNDTSTESFRRHLIPWQVAQTLADWEEKELVTTEILLEAQVLAQAHYSLADID